MVTDKQVDVILQQQQDAQRAQIRAQLESKQRAEAEKAAQAKELADTLAMIDRERTALPERIRAHMAERSRHVAKLAEVLAPIVDASHGIQKELREFDRLRELARFYGENFDSLRFDPAAVDIAPTNEYTLYAVGIARAISAGSIGWVGDEHRRYFFSRDLLLNITLDNP